MITPDPETRGGAVEGDGTAVRRHWKPVAQAFRRGALLLASVFYGAGARLHRRIMRATSARRGRLACAVVSVGGLTVGGAGKTPFAARLASGLQRRGWRVVLASRGYKGGGRDPVSVVSDGSFVHSSVAHAGDEAFVLTAHAPGVPVLVGRDRRVVGHHAVSAFDAQILVLDDGFQHHRLARDFDIVCIDGTGGFGNGRLLPAGPLREPISALREADWLCLVDGPVEADAQATSFLVGAEHETQIAAISERSHGDVIRARRRPVELVSLDRARSSPLESLRGRRVGLLAGIARPASLRQTLESLGAIVVAERRFPDHHAYTSKDIRNLDPSDLMWITTEKDAIKILPDWLAGNTLWVLRIEVEIEDEDAVLARLETRLETAGRLTRPTVATSDRIDVARSASVARSR